MNISILQIGKTKHSFFQEAEEEYIKRLQSFAKLKIQTLKESVLPAGPTASAAAAREIVKNKEGEFILQNLPKNSFVIALTETGKSINSLQFAEFLKQKQDTAQSNLTFIIGGPYGLSQKVLQQANYKLSFSAFTFTHEIIRILLLEQLYRAFTILKGKTYHY